MCFLGHSDKSESASSAATQAAYLLALEAAISAHVANGLSVVIVNASTKQPLSKWKCAQLKPTPAAALLKQVRAAHSQGYPCALALVLGIPDTRRITLEFDSREAAHEFESAFPHLLDTYTVLSANRKLPHYHFIAPEGVLLKFAGAAGAVELRGAGQYVLIPPSQNERGAYTAANPAAARRLSESEYNELRSWVASKAAQLQPTPAAGVVAGVERVQPTRRARASSTKADYTRLYAPSAPSSKEAALVEAFEHTLATVHSRNEALFRSALLARDSGITRQRAAAALIPTFTRTPAIGNHAPQSLEAREHEAARTIESAYSRPAGKPRMKATHEGLPNKAREKLLNSGARGRALARVLDCLYAAGAAGKWLSERAIVELCKAQGIGRNTVLGALFSYTPSEQSEKTCSVSVRFEDRIQERQQQRGRRPVLRRIPSRIDVCRALGIPVTVSTLTDALPAAGVGKKPFAARVYRARLIHALIERRPAQYTQQWLAARVGVRRRQTVARYIVENVEIEVTRRTIESRLYWHTARAFSEGEHGTYLEYEGKRYPPRIGIALKLLKLARGRPVWHVRIQASHYRVRTLEEREAAALDRLVQVAHAS